MPIFDIAKVAKEWLAFPDDKSADKYLDTLTEPQQRLLHQWVQAAKEAIGQGKNKVSDDLAEFAEKWSVRINPNSPWTRARHLDLIADSLRELEQKKNRYLMIAVGPRRGKSEMCSFWQPIWRLCKDPTTRIGICSYSADLAEQWAGRIRNFFRDFGEELGVTLDPTSTAKHNWLTTAGGGVRAAGRGGPISGFGFDLLILDDVLKNAEEAGSDEIRKDLWEWWVSVVLTRMEPQTAFCIIGTRWHFDDLAGKLETQSLNGQGLKWKSIKLPELAEPGDPLGRKVGDPLWPERFPMSMVLEVKKGTPAYFWSAMFQQSPVPVEGGLFKFSWWTFYKVLPDDFDIMIQSWDLSFKDLKTSDYTVGQIWGRKGARFYLVDQIRAQMNAKDVIAAIKAFTQKYPKARAKLIEDKANGPAVIALLQHEVGGLIPVKVKAGKEARAMAVQPFVEAGNCVLPDPAIAAWSSDFQLELAQFPHGAHDDQCFVAGTLVATPFGDKPIEQLRAGDLVLRPGGVTRVEVAGLTGETKVISNLGLCGTSNHPIWQGTKFTSLSESVKPLCDTIGLWNQIRWTGLKLWNSWERNTVSWEGREDIILASQPGTLKEKVQKVCMWLSGNSSLVSKFQRVGLCITRIPMHLIIVTAIWSVYRGSNILKTTLKIGQGGIPLKHVRTIWRKLGPLLRNGMEALKVGLGIENMLAVLFGHRRLGLVSTVGNPLWPNGKQTSVLPSVAINNEELRVSTEELESVLNVTKSLALSYRVIQVEGPKSVVSPAEARAYGKTGELKKVYNLRTKAGVYYANGLLVSNCDALTQAINYLAPGGWMQLDREHSSALTMQSAIPDPMAAHKQAMTTAIQKARLDHYKRFKGSKGPGWNY